MESFEQPAFAYPFCIRRNSEYRHKDPESGLEQTSSRASPLLPLYHPGGKWKSWRISRIICSSKPWLALDVDSLGVVSRRAHCQVKQLLSGRRRLCSIAFPSVRNVGARTIPTISRTDGLIFRLEYTCPMRSLSGGVITPAPFLSFPRSTHRSENLPRRRSFVTR